MPLRWYARVHRRERRFPQPSEEVCVPGNGLGIAQVQRLLDVRDDHRTERTDNGLHESDRGPEGHRTVEREDLHCHMRQTRGLDQPLQLFPHDAGVTQRGMQRRFVHDGVQARWTRTREYSLASHPELDGQIVLLRRRVRVALVMDRVSIRLGLQQPRHEHRLVADDVDGDVFQLRQVQQGRAHPVPVLGPPPLARCLPQPCESLHIG